MRRAALSALGHGLPAREMTNDELATIVDTNDEWIFSRTGIRARRVCGEGESTGTLALLAAREALAKAALDPADLDLVILATISGDQVWPATAPWVATELGVPGGRAGAYDLSAACAGFPYALDAGAAAIETGRAERVLVIGADALTRQLDWTDRTTCVLFGDGAGAAVLEPTEEPGRGLRTTVLRSDGGGRKHLGVEVGGSLRPVGSPGAEGRKDKIHQAGSEVYRFAVTAMPDACLAAMAKAGIGPDEVDLLVPHQANIRIVTAAAERLGIPMARVMTNMERYGNTSAGSIPLALYEAERDGRLTRGMTVLTVGFGGGLVWAANVIGW